MMASYAETCCVYYLLNSFKCINELCVWKTVSTNIEQVTYNKLQKYNIKSYL
jgi:hypothetical protein